MQALPILLAVDAATLIGKVKAGTPSKYPLFLLVCTKIRNYGALVSRGIKIQKCGPFRPIGVCFLKVIEKMCPNFCRKSVLPKVRENRFPNFYDNS